MADEQQEHEHGAKPIDLQGEIWAPPSEDDAAATAPHYNAFMGPDGLRAGWGIAIFLALLIAGLTLIGFVIAKTHVRGIHHVMENGHVVTPPSFTLFTHGTLLIPTLIAAFVMSLIEKRRFTQYGLDTPSARRIGQSLAGLCWGLAQLSLLVFALKVCGLLVFDGRALGGSDALKFGIEWLGGMLLVAVTEEYLLRGYLQFTLARGIGGLRNVSPQRKAIGFWIAAFIWSAVFGLMHKGNPGESPFGLVAAALAGLVLCFGLWRTGSLWWSVGWHTGWNWAQTYLFGVADSGTMGRGHLLNTHPTGNIWLSGGLTGPEGSVFVLPTLLITVLIILFTLRKQAWPEHQE